MSSNYIRTSAAKHKQCIYCVCGLPYAAISAGPVFPVFVSTESKRSTLAVKATGKVYSFARLPLSINSRRCQICCSYLINYIYFNLIFSRHTSYSTASSISLRVGTWTIVIFCCRARFSVSARTWSVLHIMLLKSLKPGERIPMR